MDSRKKLILFICPAFFDYEISIKEALLTAGYNVDFFDERLSNNSLLKAVFRVKKNLLAKAINKYYNSIAKKIKNNNYDYFFLIKGEVIPEWFILNFKTNNPQAKLVYYTFDSIDNNTYNSIYILKHFDACYSFDFDDVKNNPLLKLKHLFYTKEYLIKNGDISEKKFSISFVGTLHSNRYKVVKSIINKFCDTFVFYYSPARWFFFIEKLYKSDYRNIKWAEVSFIKLTKQEVAEIFRSSKCVLDIERQGQTGLTMRTFEVLASNAVLITTNKHIKKADFYDPNNIIVLEDVDAADRLSYIKGVIDNHQTLNTMSDALRTQYFINNWIKEFFE